MLTAPLTVLNIRCPPVVYVPLTVLNTRCPPVVYVNSPSHSFKRGAENINYCRTPYV
jgi:hypothetical protein